MHIYINHILTYTSAFVVDSLGIDLILNHPQYGQTIVQFQDTTSIPIRLAHFIQLDPYHEHIVPLITPVSSASQVSYTPDTIL